MKKVELFVIMLMLCVAGFGQNLNQGKYVGTYVWKEVVQMQRCDFDGTVDASYPAVSSIIKKQKFVIYNVVDTIAVIKILDYTKGPEGNGDELTTQVLKPRANFFVYNFDGDYDDYKKLSAPDANSRNYGEKQIYYRIPLKVLNSYATKSTTVSGGLSLGVINYPFKYRLLKGRSDFSGSFNMGAALGYKMRHDSLSKWSTTFPLMTFSVTNVNIDSVAATRNQSTLRSTNNFSAISFATGIIIENNKIQFGLFFGFDKISRLNNLQYGWIYQNKPWFSIGFGYSLFSSESQSKSSGSTQQNL